MVDAKSSRPLRSSIVASAHLAEQSQELSELEYGIIVASAALMRWMERCMQACGTVEMNALDVMVLHNLTSRGGPSDRRISACCSTWKILTRSPMP